MLPTASLFLLDELAQASAYADGPTASLFLIEELAYRRRRRQMFPN